MTNKREHNEKLIAIAAIAGTVLLTGCSETVEGTSNEKLSAAAPVMSQIEKDMLDVVGGPSFLNRYDAVYTAIVNKRIKFGEEPVARAETEVPFCDVINTVLESESQTGLNHKTYSLNNQWTVKYGITLKQQCSQTYAELKLATQEQIEAELDRVVIEDQEFSKKEIKAEKIIEESVVINEDVLLSPELVRELRGSVKDCNRAKVRLMNVVDAGEALTTKHYDEVKGLVLQCEMLKLEVELNK
ncbi:hypothetical protein VPFG_00316 [Vibrio phage nt-1]|uniref:Lipoprotein n=1 Tax=Vibrio phage nt-1 TaxID=115992 RepID=R9TFQ1_9CAUD|nr:hypothetical protein VPFG_00316 [Vibrio phage nt-1]AGN30314.1 hypothetical protein VPFG_00316 [Vibrio phage nt-1]